MIFLAFDRERQSSCRAAWIHICSYKVKISKQQWQCTWRRGQWQLEWIIKVTAELTGSIGNGQSNGDSRTSYGEIKVMPTVVIQTAAVASEAMVIINFMLLPMTTLEMQTATVVG